MSSDHTKLFPNQAIEFVEVGSLNKRTLKLRGSFTFGFVRENQLYFISDANEMLVVTQFGN